MTVETLFYVAAYGVGLALFLWMASKRSLLTEGVLVSGALGLAAGAVSASLVQWAVSGHAGHTILGGFAGGYLGVVFYKKKIGLKRPLGDLFAVALSGGEAVGRAGCFLAGCCYGKKTASAWAVWQHGAYRYPTQIYLMVSALVTLAVLLVLERKKLPENTLFYVQGLCFCFYRFVIEYYRAGSPTGMLGLTPAQWACAAGFLFFAIQFYLLRMKTRSQVYSSFPSRMTASAEVTH